MTLDPATYLRDVMPDPKAHLGMHPLPDGSLRLRDVRLMQLLGCFAGA